MVQKAIICSCKVSAWFDFVSTPYVIFFTLLSIQITPKTLYLEMFSERHLIVDYSDGLQCRITRAYILFLFCFMMYSLSRNIFSFISHIFCLEGLFSSSSVKSSGMCLASKSMVEYSIPVSLHTTSSACLKYFKIYFLTFYETCPR